MKNKKYKKVAYVVVEYFNSMPEVKAVYELATGLRSVAPGVLGYITTCHKLVEKEDIDSKKSRYMVRYMMVKNIETGELTHDRFWNAQTQKA